MGKYLLTLFFISCLLAISYGQNDKFDSIRNSMQQQFNQFANSKKQEYSDFRDKVNAAYAERMKVSWKTFQLRAAEPIPVRPEPPKPVVKSDKEDVPTKPVPIGKVVKPVETESPQPFQPIARPEKEESPQYSFQFHHTPCDVHLQKTQRFILADASESSAAEAWKRMSANGFDVVADDCFRYKELLSLNDWGYIELTKTLACDFMGKGTNEAVLMQIYLLVQSGFKVRIARRDGQLVPLIPFSNLLYNYSCLLLDGEWYYLMDDEKNGGSYSVFTEKFKGEKTPSLSIQAEPQFAENLSSPKTFASRRYPNAAASVSTNKNLIEFYNSYPVTGQWDQYAKASLSRKIKRDLYPKLKQQISGKTEQEAANILLNFVQTAFDYQTDQEQFGYERPLFGDELFYYHYSDCEDRSILYSILVHDLLHLDVVMLLYPGHLATAVRFTENVSGYYFMVNGGKYVICDPTYIGAPVGDCMPQYIGTAAEIVMIYE
jgi:hypothetical protein